MNLLFVKVKSTSESDIGVERVAESELSVCDSESEFYQWKWKWNLPVKVKLMWKGLRSINLLFVASEGWYAAPSCGLIRLLQRIGL